MFVVKNRKDILIEKEFFVKSKALENFRRGDEIVLREPAKGLARAFELLANLPDDFLAEGRQDMPPQHRKGLRFPLVICWTPTFVSTFNVRSLGKC